VTGVVIPVLAALAGWLATMYGIQHSLIELPFLSGTRMPIWRGVVWNINKHIFMYVNDGDRFDLLRVGRIL